MTQNSNEKSGIRNRARFKKLFQETNINPTQLGKLDDLIKENSIIAYREYLERIKQIDNITRDEHPNIYRLQEIANLNLEEQEKACLSAYQALTLQPKLQTLLLDLLIEKKQKHPEKIDIHALAEKFHEILMDYPNEQDIKNQCIYFRDLLLNLGILSKVDFYQLFKNEFIKIHKSELEKESKYEVATKLSGNLPDFISSRIAESNIAKQIRDWDRLCDEFKAHLFNFNDKYPHLNIDVSNISIIFTRSDEKLDAHQQKVKNWLNSPAAYKILKCKDTWPIVKKIRDCILQTMGILKKETSNQSVEKSFDLTRKTMFASDTHKIALKIAGFDPKKPRV